MEVDRLDVPPGDGPGHRRLQAELPHVGERTLGQAEKRRKGLLVGHPRPFEHPARGVEEGWQIVGRRHGGRMVLGTPLLGNVHHRTAEIRRQVAGDRNRFRVPGHGDPGTRQTLRPGHRVGHGLKRVEGPDLVPDRMERGEDAGGQHAREMKRRAVTLRGSQAGEPRRYLRHRVVRNRQKDGPDAF